MANENELFGELATFLAGMPEWSAYLERHGLEVRIVDVAERAGVTLDKWTYVVTDVETDGPDPGRNSMLALASVAVGADGAEVSAFEATLRPRPDAEADPATLEWFATEPETWRAATDGARPAADVMASFVRWVRGLPGAPAFAAHPLAFDGAWVDRYLRLYTPEALLDSFRAPDRLFPGPTLCLRSFAAGRLGWPPASCEPGRYPAGWLGGHAHSHRALDDARGYAALLRRLLARPPAGPSPD